MPTTQPKTTKRLITQALAGFVLVAIITVIILISQSSKPIGVRSIKQQADTGPQRVKVDFQGDRTTWQLLALPDDVLEKVSLVELNLAVVREIQGYEDLDASKYEAIVDQWAQEFAKELPKIEATFRGREAEYKNDIRFYRIGQLMAWLGHKKNIEYIPQHRGLREVTYKDPAELFLYGLLDTRQGTCANMPALQVAIARRMGWPVALAPVESHTVCRFDDGEVAYNIETTHTDKGGFAAGTESDYAKEFKLPRRAFTQADTLETMSAREMLAYFIALRSRYYSDTGEWEKADQDISLARAILPRHRQSLRNAIGLALQRSAKLYDPREKNNPVAEFASIGQELRDWQKGEEERREDDQLRAIAEVEHISAENQRRWARQFEHIHQLNRQNQQGQRTHDPLFGTPPNPFNLPYDPYQHLHHPQH